MDVAREAGVSKSLVSLAIRGDAGVSTATRKRILKVASDLGYRSNRWARSLVAGRTHLVGVLLNDLGNAHNTDLVDAIEEAASPHGLGVLVNHGRRDPELLQERLGSLVELGLDGLIVVSAHTPPAALEAAAATAPTVVVANPQALPDGVSQVRNDDAAGARQAVEHLIARGHTRIAFLAGSTSHTRREREAAYRAVLREHGLEASTYTDEAFLRAPERPTAVFASNDRTAARLLGAAADAGLAVPEDLAIVGYDDTELARLLRPRLTTVSQPHAEMGRLAMEVLLAGSVERVVLTPTLVVRESA